MERKRKRKIKLWQIAIAIPLTCGLGGWAMTAFMGHNAKRALDKELAALRAMGVPTTPAELQRSVRPADDAAPIYTKAIAEMKRVGVMPPQRTGGVPYERALPGERVHREWVASHSGTLTLLTEAAAKPEYVSDVDWASGDIGPWPGHSFTNLATIARNEASYEATKLNFSESLDWLRVVRKVSVHVRERGILFHFTSHRCEDAYLSELQEQIALYGANIDFLKVARKFLLEPTPATSMADAMAGDCAMVCISFENVARGRDTWDDFGFEKGIDSAAGLQAYALEMPSVHYGVNANLVRTFRRVVSVLRSNTDLMSAKRELERLDREVEADMSLIGRISAIFAPMSSQIITSYMRIEAHRRMTRTMLDLYEQKAKSGSFPGTLDASKPYMIDPCSGKPFIYRREKGRFILYSVGPNGTDEGGKPFRAKVANPGDDVEIRVPRP